MARKTKTLTVSMPPELYDQVVALAKKENRSQSELVREAVRKYSVRRVVDLDEIDRRAQETRRRLGLPEPLIYTDEEIADYTRDTIEFSEDEMRALREMGIL